MLISAEKLHQTWFGIEGRLDHEKETAAQRASMVSQAPNEPPCPSDLRAELDSFLGHSLMSPPLLT